MVLLVVVWFVVEVLIALFVVGNDMSALTQIAEEIKYFVKN